MQSLDHSLANRALMNSAQVATLSESHARLNADFPATARNDANSPARLSDHDPAVVLLTLKPLRRADLSVTANAANAAVYAGDTIRYSVALGNAGPDAARFAAVAFALDAAVKPTVTAAPGVAAQTVVTCTTAQFAAGAAQRFEVAVPAGADLVGRTLTLAASVASQTEDPNGGNNGASAAVALQAAPAGNLALRIGGPATLPLTAFSANYRLALVNHGNAPVKRASLSVSGSAVAAAATRLAVRAPGPRPAQRAVPVQHPRRPGTGREHRVHPDHRDPPAAGRPQHRDRSQRQLGLGRCRPIRQRRTLQHPHRALSASIGWNTLEQGRGHKAAPLFVALGANPRSP